MSRRRNDARRGAQDAPDAARGQSGPVRDKGKLGDTQYSVTPPRERVRAPREQPHSATCAACGATLDPVRSLRSDGEEYAYHFCDVSCRNRWRAQRDASAADQDRADPLDV
jgi:hypothetical protein